MQASKAKSFITVLFVLLSISISVSIYAAPDAKEYQVELIIFKFNNTSDIYKETWPSTELKIPTNAIALTSEVSNNNYYTLLPKSNLKYNSEYSKIHNNSRYKVISHLGWIQPKKDLLSKQPIHITTGKWFNNPKANNSSANKVPEINGVISFSLKKYVHVNFDLTLSLPARATNDISKPFELITNNNINGHDVYLQSFAIHEQRRLKNKELNYFDNPVFGAILVVNELSA